ncbi:hypothetical protein CROQUDRAFT_36320 [Cronartium quercuum f. sp. fusiforme G11]|uniref:Ribonuclease H n=1 Tax=Cronartium quercuum f. sp. fusiforme G11 TaxID=708437 RepID=A0A9P6NWN0_9BASI|nr:hypothetical protein CROQUDRAFT_36320 [Cronartium quercuum f. sp. fusiforme G11]
MPKAKKTTHHPTGSSAPTAFYAVHIGRCPGVYTSWADVRTQVDGFPRARHKKFGSSIAAKHFVITGTDLDPSNAASSKSKSKPKASSSLSSSAIKPKKQTNNLAPADATTIRVYCDGACSGNGQKNVLTPAGSGVWWEPNDNCPVTLPANLAYRLPGPVQTNNRAELYAIYLVLKHDPDPNMKLEIYTDSQYSINCLTVWLSSWLKNDWKTSSGKPVENRDLIDSIRNLLYKRDQVNRNGTKLIHVKGHSGCFGNEEADHLARMGAEKEAIPVLLL